MSFLTSIASNVAISLALLGATLFAFGVGCSVLRAFNDFRQQRETDRQVATEPAAPVTSDLVSDHIHNGSVAPSQEHNHG
jgi:hypothetical protein